MLHMLRGSVIVEVNRTLVLVACSVIVVVFIVWLQ